MQQLGINNIHNTHLYIHITSYHLTRSHNLASLIICIHMCVLHIQADTHIMHSNRPALDIKTARHTLPQRFYLFYCLTIHLFCPFTVPSPTLSYANPPTILLLFSAFQMYNLYSEENLEFSGLSRSFLFRRLEPWTSYTLTLEACTSVGCARSPPQLITTAAAPPASQPPPKPLLIGPDYVSLSWGPPGQPNGPIGEYILFGRHLEEAGMGRSNEEDNERAKVGENRCTAQTVQYKQALISESILPFHQPVLIYTHLSHYKVKGLG